MREVKELHSTKCWWSPKMSTMSGCWSNFSKTIIMKKCHLISWMEYCSFSCLNMERKWHRECVKRKDKRNWWREISALGLMNLTCGKPLKMGILQVVLQGHLINSFSSNSTKFTQYWLAIWLTMMVKYMQNLNYLRCWISN